MLKKSCGDFVMLDITRLLDIFAMVLIPGDGKKIRVQFCCETFLPPILFSLKHTLTLSEFAFPWSFPSLYWLIYIHWLTCCDHYILLFLPTIWSHTHLFSILGLFICFRHLSIWLSPSPFLDSVNSYSKSSSAFNHCEWPNTMWKYQLWVNV